MKPINTLSSNLLSQLSASRFAQRSDLGSKTERGAQAIDAVHAGRTGGPAAADLTLDRFERSGGRAGTQTTAPWSNTTSRGGAPVGSSPAPGTGASAGPSLSGPRSGPPASTLLLGGRPASTGLSVSGPVDLDDAGGAGAAQYVDQSARLAAMREELAAGLASGDTREADYGAAASAGRGLPPTGTADPFGLGVGGARPADARTGNSGDDYMAGLNNITSGVSAFLGAAAGVASAGAGITAAAAGAAVAVSAGAGLAIGSGLNQVFSAVVGKSPADVLYDAVHGGTGATGAAGGTGATGSTGTTGASGSAGASGSGGSGASGSGGSSTAGGSGASGASGSAGASGASGSSGASGGSGASGSSGASGGSGAAGGSGATGGSGSASGTARPDAGDDGRPSAHGAPPVGAPGSSDLVNPAPGRELGRASASGAIEKRSLSARPANTDTQTGPTVRAPNAQPRSGAGGGLVGPKDPGRP